MNKKQKVIMIFSLVISCSLRSETSFKVFYPFINPSEIYSCPSNVQVSTIYRTGIGSYQGWFPSEAHGGSGPPFEWHGLYNYCNKFSEGKWYALYTFSGLEKPNKVIGNSSCAVGNPISVSNGNKYHEESLLNHIDGLKIYYNSISGIWDYSFNKRIDFELPESIVYYSGKSIVLFDPDDYSADADIFLSLDKLSSPDNDEWLIKTNNGVEELYNSSGKLLSISNLQGQTSKLTYNNNDLETIVTYPLGDVLVINKSEQGHLLNMLFNNQLIQEFNFDEEGRLLSRTDATGQTTTYHYEDTSFPKHLTGITGADGVRFATWAYDDQGRGILSEHAGQERATLVFNDDGSTTVTNSLGKQTTYHFELIQGLKRPVAIEGHATENCIAANKAYTYHANGLVETQTDWSGNVTRFEYNDRGLMTRRVEAEGTPQQRETLTTWHAELPLRVEQIVAGEKTTYRYDGQNRLSATETLAAE